MTDWIRRFLSLRKLSSPGVGGGTPVANGTRWDRIAEIEVEGAAGKRGIRVSSEVRYRYIKLRARQGAVEVFRWTLRFADGSSQELTMRCLFEGSESQTILIGDRRLLEMAVEYDAPRGAKRGVLEVWAQPGA